MTARRKPIQGLHRDAVFPGAPEDQFRESLASFRSVLSRNTEPLPEEPRASVKAIDAIEAWQFHPRAAYHLGNVIRYVALSGDDDPRAIVEDLMIARWYLDRAIGLLRSEAAGE
ncbi:MAG: hypothetical protein AAGF12_22515 [Myxococcota bacterium]